MIRILGACCIVTGCGGFGFAMAAAHRREEAELVRLISALEYMSCELSYRMTPLAALCRSAASEGMVGDFFRGLASELERGDAPDVQVCVRAVLEKMDLPRELGRQFQQLGDTLGRFDLPGQLRGLEGAIRSAGDALRRIRDGADGRRRSWQTLGLCAGAALAILFV